MRIYRAYVLAVLFLLVLPARHAAATETSGGNTITALALELVDALATGDYEEAAANFDRTMKLAMTPAKAEESWKSLQTQVGQFIEYSGVRTQKYQQYEFVFVRCEFKLMTTDIKVVFDGEKRVSGLWFVQTDPSEEYTMVFGPDDDDAAREESPEKVHAPLDSVYRPPDYADTTSFHEVEVIFGEDEWRLPGTLAIPNKGGPFPAVVLVHGSGPQDRDESVGPNKPFRDLAWGLATGGIAVLRYEKRTKEHIGKLAPVISELTVKEETIDDALSAVALLEGYDGIDPDGIFVLGHSLGGMLVPKIGLRGPSINGFIIMAGTTRPLEDVILEQISYIYSLDGEVSETEAHYLEIIEAQAANVKDPSLSLETDFMALPFGVAPAYWLSLRGYQPAEEAKRLEKPMLILQGERDYQVTSADFWNWRSALSERDNVELKLYPSLNHLFIEGEGRSIPEEYESAGNVSREVIDDIIAWVEMHAAR